METKFNTEHLYVIAENYFNPLDSQILLEICAENIIAENGIPTCDTAMVENLLDERHIEFDSFIGKGRQVNVCRFISLLAPDEAVEDYDLIFRENENGKENSYGFYLDDILFWSPLVEGEIEPGIYRNLDIGGFFQLNETTDLPVLCSMMLDNEIYPYQYKLICRREGIEMISVNEGVVSDPPAQLEWMPVYPFTYFDLHCPICSSLVITKNVKPDNSVSNELYENRCQHYVGQAAMEYDLFVKDSLKDLEMEYKLGSAGNASGQTTIENLYIMTETGWRKPVIYVAPFDPLESFWGRESDAIDDDVFLFLEAGKIVRKNTQ